MVNLWHIKIWHEIIRTLQKNSMFKFAWW